MPRLRLAAYEDTVYQRAADGTLTVEQAFPLFMWGLAGGVERLVVLGRLDPAAGRSHYAVPSGGEFRALPHYGSAADPLALARAAVGTARSFWRVLGEVDAIWVNGPSPMALLAAVLALLRRKRLVLGVRQSTRDYARSRFPGRRLPVLAFDLLEGAWRLLARVGRVTTVGPQLHAAYAHAPRNHELAVSFVGAQDIAGPEVTAAREKRLRRPADAAGAEPVRLLSVGRLETEKNPLLLADIVAALGQGYHLRVVGDGPLRADLSARLEALGVADRAELLGYVPLDQGLVELYRSADIFLHVSWTEGLPQVLLEAFAARLPVVATAVGGVGAIAGGAAALIPPGDANAAAEAVRTLASDAALRERHLSTGLQRVRARTAEAERDRLLAFISGAL